MFNVEIELSMDCRACSKASIFILHTVKSRAVARLGQQHVLVSSTPQKVKSLNSSTSWLVATTSMYSDSIFFPIKYVKSNFKVLPKCRIFKNSDQILQITYCIQIFSFTMACVLFLHTPSHKMKQNSLIEHSYFLANAVS